MDNIGHCTRSRVIWTIKPWTDNFLIPISGNSYEIDQVIIMNYLITRYHLLSALIFSVRPPQTSVVGTWWMEIRTWEVIDSKELYLPRIFHNDWPRVLYDMWLNWMSGDTHHNWAEMCPSDDNLSCESWACTLPSSSVTVWKKIGMVPLAKTESVCKKTIVPCGSWEMLELMDTENGNKVGQSNWSW